MTGGDPHHYATEDMDYTVQLQHIVPEVNYNLYVFTGLFTRIACINRVNKKFIVDIILLFPMNTQIQKTIYLQIITKAML